MRDDSGPNLGVRGVGFVLVLLGLFLIHTGYRLHKGTSRPPRSHAVAVYGSGAVGLAGAAAFGFGAFLLTAGLF